jgi:hypothetical protein
VLPLGLLFFVPVQPILVVNLSSPAAVEQSGAPSRPGCFPTSPGNISFGSIRCFDQIGQKETFHQEHEMIEATLAKAHKTRDVKSVRRLLPGAVMASRKHFDKEERIVFPVAERILSAKTLSELGETWLQRREVSAKY